jgi:hypothetical protein
VKSPLIGLSAVSGRRCADEIIVITESAKMRTVNKNNLLFMMQLPYVFNDGWGKPRGNYQKAQRYSREYVDSTSLD